MFFTPRAVKEAFAISKNAAKILRYKRDILPVDVLARLEQRIADLTSAARSGDKAAIAKSRKALETDFGRVPDAFPNAFQENTEVIIVAIILALGLRAYVLQPFKIPTGSMQPTLNGIIAHPSTDPAPALPVRLFESLWLGRSYYDITARTDEQVISVVEQPRMILFTDTVVKTTAGRYTLPMPADVVKRQLGIYSGKGYRAGEIIARGHVDTGDQVFVDKVSYHFIPPRRGEVFVFKTNAIAGIQSPPGMGAQHYIKRLVGLPHDLLKVEPPNLIINGKPAEEPAIRRVMAAKDDYRGYSAGGFDENGRFRPAPILGEGGGIRLRESDYFAMGDNSYNSYDSRGWGPVPERNLVGRGLFVWWPFNNHWGIIN